MMSPESHTMQADADASGEDQKQGPGGGRALHKLYSLLWLGVALLAGWVLWQHLRTTDFAAIATQLRSLPPVAVLAAFGCCVLSYTLVGLYEGFAVRLASGRHLHRIAFVTALIANPIGHVVGAATFSGGAV